MKKIIISSLVLSFILFIGFIVVLRFYIFEGEKKIEINANREAYLIYYCDRGEACYDVGVDEEVVDKFGKSEWWSKEYPEIVGAMKIPLSKIELLNSVRFCFEGDTTAVDYLAVVTDRDEFAVMGLVPVSSHDNHEYLHGNIREANLWVQMHGLYRPCGWGSKNHFLEFLISIFNG